MTTAERATRKCVPLESGDRLTRAEFERRYTARPDIKKAELIEGVVYVASPVSTNQHGEPHADIVAWIAVYASKHPELLKAVDSTVILDADNEVQPDVYLAQRLDGEGGTRLNERGFFVGTPELRPKSPQAPQRTTWARR